MNNDTLKMAISEANRFLVKAKELQEAETMNDLIWISGSKESGACRRASMDLTRVLADLRREG